MYLQTDISVYANPNALELSPGLPGKQTNDIFTTALANYGVTEKPPFYVVLLRVYMHAYTFYKKIT